jgi:predicted GNAT family acetyltransferase
MAGEFTKCLVSPGMGISLFVKKSNSVARFIYLSIGFEIAGDYRISYY